MIMLDYCLFEFYDYLKTVCYDKHMVRFESWQHYFQANRSCQSQLEEHNHDLVNIIETAWHVSMTLFIFLKILIMEITEFFLEEKNKIDGGIVGFTTFLLSHPHDWPILEVLRESRTFWNLYKKRFRFLDQQEFDFKNVDNIIR